MKRKSLHMETSEIPEGKFNITCSDGIAHHAEIRTPSGDLIFASRVEIEMIPGNLCTAIITVKGIPIDMNIAESNVIISEEILKAAEKPT